MILITIPINNLNLNAQVEIWRTLKLLLAEVKDSLDFYILYFSYFFRAIPSVNTKLNNLFV